MFTFTFPIRITPSLEELGTSKRTIHAMFRTAHDAIGRHWVKNFLTLHFTPGAAAKYRYQARSQRYLEYKRKKARKGKVQGGGIVDLLATGLTRDMVQSWAYVQAFPGRVTVRMHGPRYVSMRPRKAGLPNLGEEITTVDQRETEELARVGLQSIVESIRKLNISQTITINIPA